MEQPDFRSPEFLRAHIAQTMAFYHPRCIDPAGGFFHYFKDDGSVYDASHRHLVSSTRFVFNYAMASREFGNQEYREAMLHGLDYLRHVHLAHRARAGSPRRTAVALRTTAPTTATGSPSCCLPIRTR